LCPDGAPIAPIGPISPLFDCCVGGLLDWVFGVSHFVSNLYPAFTLPAIFAASDIPGGSAPRK